MVEALAYHLAKIAWMHATKAFKRRVVALYTR